MEAMQYCALIALVSTQEGWLDLERHHANRDDARQRRHDRIQRVLKGLPRVDVTRLFRRRLPAETS